MYRYTRKGGKISSRYTGPYIDVNEVVGKGVYRLNTENGSPIIVLANSRDLKLATTSPKRNADEH